MSMDTAVPAGALKADLQTLAQLSPSQTSTAKNTPDPSVVSIWTVNVPLNALLAGKPPITYGLAEVTVLSVSAFEDTTSPALTGVRSNAVTAALIWYSRLATVSVPVNVPSLALTSSTAVLMPSSRLLTDSPDSNSPSLALIA
jgi:hypothetical protein